MMLEGQRALVTGSSRGIGRGQRICMLLLSLTCCATGVFAQAHPPVFSDAKGRFAVSFPGAPTQSSNEPPTFVLAASSGIYVVSYTDAHDGGDWTQTLNAERDSTIQGLKGHVTQEKEISLGDYRGKSYLFDASLPSGAITGPVTGELRLYFNGHRFYMVMAIAPKAANGRGNAAFLDSFRLLPNSVSSFQSPVRGPIPRQRSDTVPISRPAS